MLKRMVDYLMRNKEVVTLVANGKASLIGVTAREQRALIEVIGSSEQELNQVSAHKVPNNTAAMHWYA